MRWFRFNIAGLIVFILICGVAFAALKEASDRWEQGVFNLTLLALITAVLLAIHRTGARRAFWLGFALFGGCYLGFSSIPPIESRLVTSQGLSYLHSKLPGQPAQTVALWITTNSPAGTTNAPTKTLRVTTDATGSGRVWALSSGSLLSTWGSSTENFVKIGHSLVALVLAWIGALLSRWLSRASQQAEGASQVQPGEV